MQPVAVRAGAALLLSAFLMSAQTTGLKIVVLEGQGAINNVRERRAKEPVVQVEDDGNVPVPEATVTFQLPDNGPSGIFGTGERMLTIVTDAKGQAVGRGLKPNQVVGRFGIRITVSYRGETASTTIFQTNAAPAGAAASSGGGSKKFLWIALVGGAAAGGLVAARGHGSSSQSVTVVPPGTVLVPNTPVFQPPH
ncbi:MAG: hypothetical protein DMG57_30365 [Acidobacteria bacterium]|nr:MAG: hypothetical protein DMG57_30365 [Acidobacteriota bacterium]